MTTIPNQPAATEAPDLSPAERKARKNELRVELEQLDEVRIGLQNAVRELHNLQAFLDKNPVRFRSIYNRNIEACVRYTEAFAVVSNEYRKLDNELTGLCRSPRAGELLGPVAVDQFGEILDEVLVTPGILAQIAGGGL